MLVHHLILHVSFVLAGTVPNPAPVSPISSSGVNLILGYAKWGSFSACGGPPFQSP